MTLQSFLHILNPNQKNRPAVRKYFNKNPKLSYVWVDRTSHPTHLETVIEWALLQGQTKLAIWGGDGSFNRTVQELYRREVLAKCELALIPVGTGNDFARKLQLGPWSTTLSKIFSNHGKIEKFDLGLVETGGQKRIFVNNSGFGRSLESMSRARPDPIEDIRSLTEKKLAVECEAGESKQYETSKVLMGIVFNSPYFNKGLYFDKQISPADGILNAVFVPPQNRFKLFWRFLKGRLGISLASRRDQWFQGRQIRIDSNELLYPQVDGEAIGKTGVKKIQYSILENQLNLLVSEGEK